MDVDALFTEVQNHIAPDTIIYASIVGRHEKRLIDSAVERFGIMVLTDSRIIFYSKQPGGYDLEHYPIKKIPSFFVEEDTDETVFFFIDQFGNDIRMTCSDRSECYGFITRLLG